MVGFAGPVVDLEGLVGLIDDGLDRYRWREVVTGREYRDVLLDLRLACTGLMQQQGGTGGDRKLQERTRPQPGGDPDDSRLDVGDPVVG